MAKALPTNEMLGKRVSCWMGQRCARCNRSTEETVLNIEAVIHHKAKALECVDRADCWKASKKLKK